MTHIIKKFVEVTFLQKFEEEVVVVFSMNVRGETQEEEGREKERGEPPGLHDTHHQNLLQRVVVVLSKKRRGRLQHRLRKKSEERHRGENPLEERTLQGYMTHIFKISCGDKVCAKEFEQKVAVVFSERRRRRQQHRLRKKREERQRGENPSGENP